MEPTVRYPASGGPPSRPQVRETVKHLRTEVVGTAFVLKLALCAAITALGALLALQDPIAARIVGTILLGLMFAHAAELQHQALHGLSLRNRSANAVSGIILGIPMLISFSAYRATHLRHHRDLGTAANREFFDYGDQYGRQGDRSNGAVALAWVLRFSMLRHYTAFGGSVLRALRGKDFDGETASTSRRIRRDNYVIFAALTGSLAWSAAVGSAAAVRVWLLPLVLVAGPVHAAIELPEHFRCETLSENPFANTRTIRSNRLMTWFTNGNNYHVEHHLMPNLPIERLPDLHAEVRGRLVYFQPGYIRYFRDLVRNR
jgi:fatty acid desaturase